MNDLPEHVRRNRVLWDDWAAKFAAAGEAAWMEDPPTWGIWSVAEAEIRMFPDDLSGVDAIELGCGTAYVSAWMSRRGARVVGIDNSQAQLATARRLQRQHGLDFTLLHGNAESVPYPAASFDFAISEYGACLWADPQRWVPEAARLLRPGGQLVFLVNSFLMTRAYQQKTGLQQLTACCAQPSVSTASSGLAIWVSNSTSHTAIGFASSATADSKSRSWSNYDLTPTQRRATHS